VGSEDYITWSQVKSLSSGGHEIAGHTRTHKELPTLSASAATFEINQDFYNIALRGFLPTNFASPFGAYDTTTIALIAKKYSSHRAFADQGFNFWPYNKYLLKVKYITNTTTLSEAQAWVDQAITQDAWLVVVFHEVLAEVDPTDEYSWKTATFKSFLKYLASKNIKTKTITEVLSPTHNLVQNPSFENSLNSWTTDSPQRITIDTRNKGSYPSPKNALSVVGAEQSSHLFGQKISVAYGTTYGFRAYTDSRGYAAGEVGFYIDEYDAGGNWVSGKWLGGIYNQNVIDKSYVYTPTSSSVTSAALQIYAAAQTSGTVVLDNIEFFAR